MSVKCSGLPVSCLKAFYFLYYGQCKKIKNKCFLGLWECFAAVLQMATEENCHTTILPVRYLVLITQLWHQCCYEHRTCRRFSSTLDISVHCSAAGGHDDDDLDNWEFLRTNQKTTQTAAAQQWTTVQTETHILNFKYSYWKNHAEKHILF